MRNKRLALVCTIAAATFSFALVSSGLFGNGMAQYIPRESDYSTYEYSVNPTVENNYYYPLANYAVSRNGNLVSLFERIGVSGFESGPFLNSSTGISHTDSHSYLAVHETMTTVVEFEANQDNSLIFELSHDTGAIRSGDALLIGNEDASGVFVCQGDVTTTLDGQNVLFDVPANGRVIFRADPSWDKTVGSAVAGGHVATEMYLSAEGEYLVEDAVAFDDVEIYALAASEREVEVTVSGELSTGKAVVLHIDDNYLDYGSAEGISVQLDDNNVKLGEGMSETLWETGEDARYFALKTSNGFDVVVYIPQYSDHVITIGSAERELGIDGMATLLAAIGIVGVAVLALIKKD